jgi:hypothetical protein
MVSQSRRSKYCCILVPVAAMLISACSGTNTQSALSPTAPSMHATAAIPSVPGPNLRQADVELFEVCKDYAGGSGPAVTINVAVDQATNGTIDQTFSVNLNAGACQDIWVNGFPTDTVTVTEVVPAGYTASYVRSVNTAGTIVTDASVAGNSASGPVAGGLGTLVIFTNTAESTGGGGQGCTPGYWKQPQHADSWPAPYTPNTLFSAVFEDAFPGQTLDDVLSNGGGGLNALGRHAVAALLNAASSGVSYNLSTAQVIDAFNAVFPGGDYESLKNQFEAFNVQGCPLN